MNCEFKKLALAGLLALVATAHAGTKTTTVTATGSGPSEAEATAAALAKATSQTNGTRSSTTVSTGKAVIEGHARKDEGGKKTTVDVNVSAGMTPDIRMYSSGRVSRYDVVSSEEKAGKFTVTVKAYFDKHVAEVYRAPGSASSKMRVAIFPPQWAARGDDFSDVVSGDTPGNELRDALERSFIKGGAFAVLDRQTLGTSLVELGIVGSKLTNETEKAKLKNLRGADIIVLPIVRTTANTENLKGSQITGQRANPNTDVSVEIRGIVPATGEVVFSEQYRIENTAQRNVSVNRMAGIAAGDLTYAVTGKRPKAFGDETRPVMIEANDRQVPLPPPEETGTKLPFDR